jgi:hypothetical protein
MRIRSRGRRLRGVPGSITRRQLLVRTGGATVALACLGTLPAGVAADAGLSSRRAATYRALLDAIDADPAYALAGRDQLVASFSSRYAADEGLRRYADAVLDAIDDGFSELAPRAAHDRLAGWGGRLKPDALTLAALAFEPPEDTHTIAFTL